ncbi:MAG: DUF2723 domain-containing protein [Elusimicrobia bacterium]|nr:DUF2723 domain-containing protein [Candidatus Liberimonas magnetica]
MKHIAAFLIFSITFGVLVYTTVPALTEDDSGELSATVNCLGICHSPGYPLYSLAGKILVTAMPFGNRVYCVNILSSLFIAVCAAVLFFAALELSSDILISIIIALLFSFSGLVWAMGNTTEVYGLAAFMTSLICLVMFKKIRPVSYILVFYFLGIGVLAHYTVGLLIAGIFLWFFLNYIHGVNPGFKGHIKTLRYYFPNIILFGVLGFSLVLFILIRAKAQPVFSWEDPQTLKRFWQVVARLRYGTMSLAQGGAPPLALPVIYNKIYFFFKVVIENFTVIGLLLFLYGGFLCLKDKTRGWPLILLLLGSGPGFLILANVTLDPGSESLLKRFFFLPFIFLVLMITKALKSMPKTFSRLSLALPLFLLYSNFPDYNTRNNYIFYDYAKNMINTVPKNTILFSDRADEMEFSIGYLNISKGLRPDIRFIDCNAGITKSIYGDGYYMIWGKPRLKIREDTEKSIIAASKRPVFYATFEPAMINIPRYQQGLLFRAKPASDPKERFPYHEIYYLRRPENMDRREHDLLLSYYDLLGRYYLAIGDTANADRFFKGVSAYDDKGTWNTATGFLFHSKGLLDLAEKYYTISVARGAANLETLINLGAVYESKGEIKKAKYIYAKILENSPENVQTHYNLAVLYWKEADWRKVVSELETVLKLDPNHSEARKYLQFARQK